MRMHENACVYVVCAHVFATCNFGHILLPDMAARTRTHVSAQLCSVHGSEVCMCLQVCVVPAVVTVKVSSVGVSQASQLWPGAKEPSLSHLCLAAVRCWPRSTAAHSNDSHVRTHLSPVAQIHTHTQHVLTDTAHNTNLRTHKHISSESHISQQSEMSHRHSTHALSTSTSI